MEPFSFIAGCAAGIVGILVIALAFAIIRPWVRMKTRGGKGSLPYVLYMRLRGNPVLLIIDAYTGLMHSGVITTLREVEAHYVANQSRVMTAEDLIASIRKDPVETHIRVWLDHDDAEWLGNRCSGHAKAIWDNLDVNDDGQYTDSQMASEATRYDKISQRINSAMTKVLRAQGRL